VTSLSPFAIVQLETARKIDQLLIPMVQDLVDGGILSQKDARPLLVALNQALAALARNNPGSANSATGSLGSFINKVNAYVNSGRLMQAQAQLLIDLAQEILQEL
jgi:hypothetical protein